MGQAAVGRGGGGGSGEREIGSEGGGWDACDGLSLK